jgi:hypothetical protein
MKINLPFFLSDLKEEIKIPINWQTVGYLELLHQHHFEKKIFQSLGPGPSFRGHHLASIWIYPEIKISLPLPFASIKAWGYHIDTHHGKWQLREGGGVEYDGNTSYVYMNTG